MRAETRPSSEIVSERDTSYISLHSPSVFAEKAFIPPTLTWQPSPLVNPPTLPPTHPAILREVRPTDWVLGIHLNDLHICIPNFILRLTHAVSFALPPRPPFILFHCEVCSYSAAYLNPSNEPYIAGAIYAYGMCAQSCTTHDYFAPIPGLFLSGPRRGTTLPLIPSSQCSFHEWQTTFPTSQVVRWFPRDTPAFPDGTTMPPSAIRVRHGASDIFSLPDNRPYFLHSAVLRPPPHECPCTPPEPGDHTFAAYAKNLEACHHESTITLMFDWGHGKRFLTLEAVKRRGGVANVRGDGDTATACKSNLVVLTHGEDSALCFAYQRAHPDDLFTPPPPTTHHPSSSSTTTPHGVIALDISTNSSWSITGVCIDGARRGERLGRVGTVLSKYHSFLSWHTGPSVQATVLPTPTQAYTADARAIAMGTPFLSTIARKLNTRLISRDYNISLPVNAAVGGTIRTASGGRYQVYVFADAAAAEDAAHELAASVTNTEWMSQPAIRANAVSLPCFYGFHKLGLRVGRVLIAPRPTLNGLFENQLKGSRREPNNTATERELTHNAPMRQQWTQALQQWHTSHPSSITQTEGAISATQLLQRCNHIGLDVSCIRAVAGGVAVVGCASVVLALINSEQFLVYRFDSAGSATSAAEWVGLTEGGRAVQVREFVVRSAPFALSGMVELGKERVQFSGLVADAGGRERLIGILKCALEKGVCELRG